MLLHRARRAVMTRAAAVFCTPQNGFVNPHVSGVRCVSTVMGPTDSADTTSATTMTGAAIWQSSPPPHRFVRRWFLPGVDRPSEVPPAADTRRTKGGSVPSTPHTAAKEARPESTKAAAADLSAAANTPAAKSKDTVQANTGSASSAGRGDPEEELAEGKVLLEGLHSRNAHIKTILVAGLGSGFARAGIHNDGIRTSFSAVNTQSIKQLTGLKRIPPKLMLSCLTNEARTITWLDISSHPTATLTEYKESVQEILIGLGMHQSMINDSAEPVLLPQVTVSKDMRCLLMRYATETPIDNTQDTFQDLTNRFTLFMSSDAVVTVHRTQCTYVEELKVDWQRSIQGLDTPSAIMGYLLFYFVKETLGTFSSAISRCIVQFDRYESGLFVNNKNRSNLAREIYHIKRRASVYSRTLKLTQDAFSHMAAALHVDVTNVQYQEVQHSLSHVESIAEELNANADSMLQLLFQLSSYQVNELMRVLTLFSAFFIPLSFISSAYGMNFENLPLLHTPHGELYCGGLMVLVGTVIYVWFKSKHFI